MSSSNQRLISAATDPVTTPTPTSFLSISSWLKKCHFFSYSKGILMILLWTIFVGYVYVAVVYGSLALILQYRISIEDEKIPFHTVISMIAGAGGTFALLQMLFYPVGGLIADICCGRYRIIISSVFSIWSGLLLCCIVCIIKISIRVDKTFKIINGMLLSIAALLSMIGFTGFQANAVQFGLDQLLHASSQELSSFLHWFIWADHFGQLTLRIVGVACLCHQVFIRAKIVLSCTVFIFGIIITVVMILSCWKRQWFHSEPHTHNPYGTVYRVLKFAAKHDKPLRRSALTYCDDERPTRIEFAKQKYGGPFTTEMVEDVKTFLRILIMLFVMSPIFTLQVAVDYMFPLYGIHMGNSPIINTTECSAWLLLQSGNLSYLVTVVFMPLYILFIHPYIPRWMPRILYRLTIGIFLMFLSVAAMFIIQVVANYNAIYKQDRNITCMFLSDIRNKNEVPSMLNFNIPILIFPNLLGGIAFPLVYVTILEFISAQSPHSMKGLLLGVFYAFRGFFTLIGCVLIFPFAQEKYWKDTAHVTDCGFYYYLLSTVMGLVGVAAIPAATKWYQYRVREDRPYGPFYVEEYYSRYLRGMNAQAISPVLEGRECDHHHDDRMSTYGTINN